MVSRDERYFSVVIHANDVKKIFSWVLKHPAVETGGDLFGSWEEARSGLENTLNIQYVIGPGKLHHHFIRMFDMRVKWRFIFMIITAWNMLRFGIHIRMP